MNTGKRASSRQKGRMKRTDRVSKQDVPIKVPYLIHQEGAALDNASETKFENAPRYIDNAGEQNVSRITDASLLKLERDCVSAEPKQGTNLSRGPISSIACPNFIYEKAEESGVSKSIIGNTTDMAAVEPGFNCEHATQSVITQIMLE